MNHQSKAVELNLWVMPNAGFGTRRILEGLLRRFHQANPRIRVRTSTFPFSIVWDRLMTSLKRPHWPLYPDVLQIGSTWTCTLAFLGALRELTPRLDELDRDNFIPTVLESCYLPHTRRLFAVPWFMDLRLLYYRRDILKSLGIKPGDLDTWESFRRVCHRITRARGRHRNLYTLAMSGQKGEVLIHDLAPWIWGGGGNFFTADDRHTAFDRPEAMEGLKFFFSLMVDGCIPLLGRDRFASGNFFTGHSVLQFSGTWPLNSYFRPGHKLYRREVAGHFGTAPFPLGPAGRFTFLGGSHLAISAMTRYPDESWALLRFLSSPQAQLDHAKAIGMLPCRQSELPGLFAGHEEAGRVFLESLTYARLLPQVPTLGTLERMFVRCTSDIVKMIVKKEYTVQKLQECVRESAQESNYILSLYG